MPLKDPNNINVFALVIMGLCLSVWGGTVNYLMRIKRGEVKVFSLIEWVGEVCISSFSGVMIGLLGLHYEIDLLLVMAMVGVAGHAGGRTVSYLELVFSRQFDNLTQSIKRKP